MILAESECEDSIEAAKRCLPLAELEQYFPETSEPVLVGGLQSESLAERMPGPDEFVACEAGIPQPHMQLRCQWEGLEGFEEDANCVVVTAVGVKPMRPISVIIGTQERIRNSPRLR